MLADFEPSTALSERQTPAATATGSVYGPGHGQAAGDVYVEVYYDKTYSTNGNTFTADTESYQLQYDLSGGTGIAYRVKTSSDPDRNLWRGVGLMPALRVNGEWYKPTNADGADRLYFHEAGKNLWKVEKPGIELANDAGAKLPLLVDQTFYFWHDKSYVTTVFRPQAAIEGIEYAELVTVLDRTAFTGYNAGAGDRTLPSTADQLELPQTVPDHLTVFDASEATHGSFSYQVINKSGTESVVAASDGSADLSVSQRAYDRDRHGGQSATWIGGHATTLYTQLFPHGEGSSAAGVLDTAIELDPLDSTEFAVTASHPYEGSRSLGYDNATGAYVVEIYTPHANYYADKPNDYPSARIELAGDDKERTIRLRTELAITRGLTAPGVTGGVAMLTDENMIPNGIPVQVSKKWDNSDYTVWDSFSRSYAVFELDEGESRTMWHRTVFQNWGDKAAVGLPSLSLVNYGSANSSLRGQLWFEANIGMSEAVCYNLDYNGNATITDYRAINGVRMEGETSPWFQNAGGLEFLRINQNDGSWIDAKRVGPGMRFNRLGPNVSQFEVALRTKEDAPDVRVRVEETLLPGADGTRVFYKLRYDFDEAMSFADLQRQLTLFSMGDPRYSSRSWSKFAYLDDSGQAVQLDVTADGSWNLSGEPLSATRRGPHSTANPIRTTSALSCSSSTPGSTGSRSGKRPSACTRTAAIRPPIWCRLHRRTRFRRAITPKCCLKCTPGTETKVIRRSPRRRRPGRRRSRRSKAR